MVFSESHFHGDVHDGSFWLSALMDRCQMIVGRLGDAPPAVLIADAKVLFLGLPAQRKHTEEIVVRMVLNRMLSSVVKTAKLDGDAGIQRGFMELTSSSTIDDWRGDWLAILERGAAALRDERANARSAADVRVNQMLAVIDRRYPELGLSMREVAREVSLSVDHAALLLKQRTGAGFLFHLRRVRIAAAQRLLLTSTLSVKEIASAVGYRHACELNRHFKMVCALTPVAFRRGHNAGVSTTLF